MTSKRARTVAGPHQGSPVARLGAEPGSARAAVILLHGRGGTVQDILGLARAFWRDDVAYVAPAAANHTWYPHPFLAPLETNEPWLSSALARVEEVLASLASEGIPPERVIVGGFSQGACLTLEHAVRNPRRYGGTLAFTGGLIGPPGTPRDYPGSLAGTPAFIASGDPDPHVPWERVEESVAVLSRMGAVVRAARYPGIGHSVVPDEIRAAREILDAVVTAG